MKTVSEQPMKEKNNNKRNSRCAKFSRSKRAEMKREGECTFAYSSLWKSPGDEFVLPKIKQK